MKGKKVEISSVIHSEEGDVIKRGY